MLHPAKPWAWAAATYFPASHPRTALREIRKDCPQSAGFLFLGSPGKLGLIWDPCSFRLSSSSTEQFSCFLFCVSVFCTTSCPPLLLAFPTDAPEPAPWGFPEMWLAFRGNLALSRSLLTKGKVGSLDWNSSSLSFPGAQCKPALIGPVIDGTQ